MPTEAIYKLEPHRTMYLRGFDRRGCAASLNNASASGFTVSGVFSDQADFAVLVLFDADKVSDTATFAEPRQAADGIDAVWVNGVLSYLDGAVTGLRAGHFVARGEGSRLDALGHF